MLTRPFAVVLAIASTCFAIALTSTVRHVPPRVNASVAHGTIRVGGKPFFPVMLLDQCGPLAPARAAKLGVSVILNGTCPAVPAQQLRTLAGAQLGVLPIGGRAVTGSRLLGWTYPDEPDNNGWTASSLAARFGYRRGNRDGLISFITTTGQFFNGPNPAAAGAIAASFARIADVAGFDLYPVNHCESSVRGVYDAQRRFARLAPGTPTFQWIETGLIDGRYCGGIEPTPPQVTAEAWLAVAGGARGIGFFTATTYPGASDFQVSPGIQRTIRAFTALAASITPGLTGTTVSATADSPSTILLGRVGGGHTYVVAVNTLTSVVPVKFAVPRVGSKTLEVVGESREIGAHGGRFTDTFAPLGVHVYETQ